MNVSISLLKEIVSPGYSRRAMMVSPPSQWRILMRSFAEASMAPSSPSRRR